MRPAIHNSYVAIFQLDFSPSFIFIPQVSIIEILSGIIEKKKKNPHLLFKFLQVFPKTLEKLNFVESYYNYVKPNGSICYLHFSERLLFFSKVCTSLFPLVCVTTEESRSTNDIKFSDVPKGRKVEGRKI